MDISNSIVKNLKDRNVNSDNIQVAGCDGTNVNTEQMAGVIRRLEESLNQPLQWLVCLLRANELSLRHLFKTLHVATTGTRGFFGSIGKRLATCSQQPVTSFKPVRRADRRAIFRRRGKPSTDQQYLLEICNGINAGE